MTRIAIIIALLALSFYGGYRYEATQIRMACDTDPSMTAIGGAQYYCLTREQLRQVVEQATQHGV